MDSYADEIGKEKERWTEECLGKRRDDRIKIDCGIEVKALYSPDDLKDMDYLRDLGFPGEYPFIRGIHPTMYRGRTWSIRQYAGFGMAEETNARFKYILKEAGQNTLSVASDLPTQLGFDSDDPDPRVADEVGRVGVITDTLDDFERIFDGIPLDKVTTAFTINATASVLLAMYIVAAEKQGVPARKVGGTIQNDILKEYVARGAYIFPPGPSMRLTSDTIEFCAREVPKFNPITFCGGHLIDAGSTSLQEAAYTLSNGIAYIEDVLARGTDIDAFAPRLSFTWGGTRDFFEMVAKIRASRRLWARIIRERFGAKDPHSWMMRCFGGGGMPFLTKEQPENNIIRQTLMSLAAVLAGVQASTAACFDEAYAIPTEYSQRIALRTHQIIAYESGVARTVDPLGGSYYLEWLTNEMEKQISSMMKKIEAQGGMVAAIERGQVQKEILDSAYEQHKQNQSGERTVVGVNKFRIEEGEKEMALHTMDPLTYSRQIERLRKVKSERDNEAVGRALKSLRKAAEGKDNLMPHIIDAVRTYATIGEMVGVLKDVFGTYVAPSGV
ncbi:MAG: methylmalonyl-CoA mutase [Chloroflexi bacterium]|nr:methylmalonyl-CoA mutase [Chloroflexota bacterium]